MRFQFKGDRTPFGRIDLGIDLWKKLCVNDVEPTLKELVKLCDLGS